MSPKKEIVNHGSLPDKDSHLCLYCNALDDSCHFCGQDTCDYVMCRECKTEHDLMSGYTTAS